MENLRIYLADDDRDDRDLFVEAAHELGAEKVIAFPNGHLLLDKLQEPNSLPDIIFLDINMPGMSGVDTLISLRAEPRLGKIPVVMYTTSSYYFSMAETLQYGASAYIVKPYSYEGLLQLLRKALNLDWKNRVAKKSNFLLQP